MHVHIYHVVYHLHSFIFILPKASCTTRRYTCNGFSCVVTHTSTQKLVNVFYYFNTKTVHVYKKLHYFQSLTASIVGKTLVFLTFCF